jgi:hypothetical protein
MAYEDLDVISKMGLMCADGVFCGNGFRDNFSSKPVAYDFFCFFCSEIRLYTPGIHP